MVNEKVNLIVKTMKMFIKLWGAERDNYEDRKQNIDVAEC